MSINSEWEVLLFHLLLSIWCCQCSAFSLFNRGIIIFPCFNLKFHNNTWGWSSFYMLIGLLYIFIGEVLVQIFYPFFKSGYSYSHCWVLRVLCCLDNGLLSNMCFSVYGLCSDSLNTVFPSPAYQFFILWIMPLQFVENTLLTIVLPWSLSKIDDHIYGGLFLGSVFCSFNIFVSSFVKTTPSCSL